MEQQDIQNPRLLTRLVRRSLILTGTGLTLALAVGAITAGAGLIAARAADTPPPTERAATPVVLSPLVETDSYEVSARFTGRVEPARATELGFELGGTLAEILVDEGDTVAQGQVLARLDIRALQADRAAQEAAIEAAIARRDIAKLTADRQSELAARDFASSQRRDEARFNLVVAEADIARSEAALAAIDVAITKSEIVAPYAGIIRQRSVDPGARVGAGQRLLSLQDKQLLLRGGLPEDLSETLTIGDVLDVELSTGEVAGEVVRLRPDLDPATRTRAVLIALPESVSVVTGTLGEIALSREIATRGAWVPVSALSEGVDGLWTVFALAQDGDRLDRVAVTLEHVSDDRAYVAGAFPAEGRVVTAGTHRLSPGQRVAPAGES